MDTKNTLIDINPHDMIKYIYLILLCLPILMTAQEWSWVNPVGPLSTSLVRDMTHTQDDGWAVVGNLWGDFEEGGWTPENLYTGFLIRFNSDGTVNWGIDTGPSSSINSGSALNLLTTQGNGDFLCHGFFGDTLLLMDTILFGHGENHLFEETNFIARFSEDGVFKWAHKFDGSARIYDLTALSGNRLAIGGFFREELTIEDNTFSFPDPPNGPHYQIKHAFVAVFDSLGHLEWILPQMDSEGFSSIIGITSMPDGSTVIAGNIWEGNVDWAGQILNSEAAKFFIAKVDQNGQLVWIKPIISAFGELKDITSDEEGKIYATGFVGNYMEVSEDIVFESDLPFHETGFLIKYDADGVAEYAKFSEGTGRIFPNEIIVKDNIIGIAGNYNNQVHFDEHMTPFTGNNSTRYGFTAGFHKDDGHVRWLIDIPASLTYMETSVNSISISENDQVLVSGHILSDALFNGEYLTDVNGFVGALSYTLTDISAVPINKQAIKTYPNPTNGILSIELPQSVNHPKVHLQLYSAPGVLIQEHYINDSIELDLSKMASGLYYWSANLNGSIIGSGRVVKW